MLELWAKTAKICIGSVLTCLLLTSPVIAEESSPDYGKRLNTIIDGIHDNYLNADDIPSKEELFREATRAILRAIGDKHGFYFDQASYTRLNESINPSNYTGVGLKVTPYKNINVYGVLILQIYDGSPLGFMGAKPGDFIWKVEQSDGTSIEATQDNFREMVGAIRGPVGSNVTLYVKRGAYDLGPITVQRITTRQQFVFVGELTDSGILPIRITEFSATIKEDLENLLIDRGLLIDGEISSEVAAVMLDLRFDPGGALSSAIDISDWLFVPKDEIIVTIISRDGPEEVKAEEDPILFGLPVAIVVNRGTASASEIVAGAAEEHNAAYLVGTKTYGKGSVQVILPLGGGTAIKTTIARYLAGGTLEIDGIGITPNMVIAQPITPGSADHYKALNRHIMRNTFEPRIDHQLHVAYEFLKMFTSGDHNWDDSSSVLAAMNKAHGTETKITWGVCEDVGLVGCPVPHGRFRGR